ncbi:hypothetical protein X943_000585 [Babesia divergens]|uniref:Uncharacterized protein n=1 Tax=Babesia divergens TaxID=32595 RepID=A0AAD9GCS8_BABDI|nr:hypothetical protein X943_000585 [Babesia divergens]
MKWQFISILGLWTHVAVKQSIASIDILQPRDVVDREITRLPDHDESPSKADESLPLDLTDALPTENDFQSSVEAESLHTNPGDVTNPEVDGAVETLINDLREDVSKPINVNPVTMSDSGERCDGDSCDADSKKEPETLRSDLPMRRGSLDSMLDSVTSKQGGGEKNANGSETAGVNTSDHQRSTIITRRLSWNSTFDNTRHTRGDDSLDPHHLINKEFQESQDTLDKSFEESKEFMKKMFIICLTVFLVVTFVIIGVYIFMFKSCLELCNRALTVREQHRHAAQNLSNDQPPTPVQQEV